MGRQIQSRVFFIIHRLILTIFQLDSAFLALTVQLKFLFLCLLVLKKFFKLVIWLSWVYIFTQTHPYTSLFASCKSIVLWWVGITYCTFAQNGRETVVTCHAVLQYFLCAFQYASIGLMYWTVFKSSLWTESLILSGAFQSGSQYFRIWILSKH